MKKIVDEKRRAQFFGGHRPIVGRVRHLQYSHWAHTLFLARIADVVIARAALVPATISSNKQ